MRHRSFILCGQGPSLLWTSILRPFELVQCASPGRVEELIGVCGMSAVLCEGGKVDLSSLSSSWVFLNTPPLGVAYCLTKPVLALVQ